MAFCGIIGSIWTAFSYVKDKLDAIEESTADISDLKEQNAHLEGLVTSLRDEHSSAINERTLATQQEFSRQRLVDAQLEASIEALRQEVRLRAGLDYTTSRAISGGSTPTSSRRVSRSQALRQAAETYDRAQENLAAVRVDSDPLAGLDGL